MGTQWWRKKMMRRKKNRKMAVAVNPHRDCADPPPKLPFWRCHWKQKIPTVLGPVRRQKTKWRSEEVFDDLGQGIQIEWLNLIKCKLFEKNKITTGKGGNDKIVGGEHATWRCPILQEEDQWGGALREMRQIGFESAERPCIHSFGWMRFVPVPTMQFGEYFWNF